jgi:putative transposase
MAPLCGEFSISRVTGYKIVNRYKDCGIDGLTDHSRLPYRQASQLPMQIEKLIVGLKKEYPYSVRPRSARSLEGCIRISAVQRSARCTRCSTIMA